MTTICYYVSGHGLGHAARSMHVIDALPIDWRILIKTEAPEGFFRQQIGRPFEYVHGRFDCGCVQSDSITVLPDETLALYKSIESENESRVDDERAFLLRERVDCVVSDIAAFPLRVARRAGIPSVAISNFTWCDIYEPFLRGDEDAALVARMARDYSAADFACVLPFNLPSMRRLFRRRQDVPLVAQRGRDIGPRVRQWIAERSDAGKVAVGRLALIYLGVWGLDFDWARLQDFEKWTFLTFEAPHTQSPNVHCLDRSIWSFADVCASVDMVAAKTGYGIVASCIANRTALAYVRRDGFAEHPALVAALDAEGLGVEIAPDNFLRADWGDALEFAATLPDDNRIVDISGAGVIADRLASIVSGIA